LRVNGSNREGMQKMRSEESTKLLKQMLEIYSPSGKEKELAHFLEEKMVNLGFKNVRLDKAGNVFGEVGRGSPTILLCGHMDTVPGRLPVKVDNGRIYGRGAVDAKSSLAAMIVAASKLVGQEMKGRIMVAGVVDEEGRGRGIRQVVHDRLGVDYAIFGEPSGVKNITIGYRGRLEVKILCETEPGHAGAPSGFNNAIEKAYGVWSQIRSWSVQRQETSRSPFYSTTASLTSIRGGEASNVIPSKCKLTVDVRLPPSLDCRKAIDQLKATIQNYKRKNPGVNLKMRIGDKVEPFIAKKDSLLVKALTWAIEDTVGGPVRLLRKTGTGDMNIFAAKMIVPVVTYGPGNSRLSHTLNEYIEISEYLATIEVYRRTAEKLLA